MNIRETLKTYFILTKPRLWILLVYTGIAGYFFGASSNLDIQTFLILFISLITGTAGANTVTSYFDRDIDLVMERTRNRPLPKGLINPPIKALYFGIGLSSIGLITSYLLNMLSFVFMLFGLIDNIIIYSYLTKRRTYWNIILGSFSGGAPVVIGYVAVKHTLDILPIIWAGLIVIWTPVHIWSLALFYKDDYRKAGVPMLPTITSKSVAIRCISASSIILVIFTTILPYINSLYLNPLYMITTIFLDIAILYISLKLLLKPDEKLAWRLFKLTSPYLAIVFTIAIILHLL